MGPLTFFWFFVAIGWRFDIIGAQLRKDREMTINRLTDIIGRAYTLSAQVLNGDDPDIALAEELSGETAEFLALLDGDTGAFESDTVMDGELVALCNALTLLDKAATLIYNMEGDQYQSAYEKLESILDSLKGAKND